MPILKLMSWNVNGIRAAQKKGFMEWFQSQDSDIVCIQETKVQPEQIPTEVKEMPGYHTYFTCAAQKGYSGVGLFSKQQPLKVDTGFGCDPIYDTEGRIICAEYPEFVLYGIYFPNGQRGDERLNYKLGFYDTFLDHANEQRAKGKSVIICGDVNTAHKEIDLARPKENSKISGFLPQERAWVDKLVANGYHDTLRLFTAEGNQYTYWDQRFRARERNVGWRIDYFFVSEDLKDKVKSAFIQPDIMGSDHCPIGITVEL
ncbi:MAG: exodeoxyribonuclease III [Chitinophagales bacterium]|nr:exodeoxyribonuclease III [Chitinophagales bacterium]